MINRHTIPIISTISLIVLACTCPFTMKNATPTPQIIYRSPQDLNIQPQDVPELQETGTDTPLEQDLLPEALDQDQKVFVNIENTIEIESLVFQMPELTQRTQSDVFDEVVTRHRPQARRVGDGRKVQVGDQGWIISFSDASCVSGMVLILYRQNMIVILIGCGADLTEDLLLDTAIRIDERIKPPPISLDENSDCDLLDLTPEECANAGRHTYAIQETSNIGACKADPSYRCTVTHEFKENRVSIFAHSCDFEGFFISSSLDYEKSGLNTYFNNWCGSEESEQYWECNNTITFTQNGFILRTVAEAHIEGVEGCVVDHEGTRE